MSRTDKLREKINDDRITVTYAEMARFLNSLGYSESNKGKTSGSFGIKSKIFSRKRWANY